MTDNKKTLEPPVEEVEELEELETEENVENKEEEEAPKEKYHRISWDYDGSIND